MTSAPTGQLDLILLLVDGKNTTQQAEVCLGPTGQT